MRPSWPTILAAAGITLATAVPTASAASPATTAVPQVRVNQSDDYTVTSLFAFALGGAGLG